MRRLIPILLLALLSGSCATSDNRPAEADAPAPKWSDVSRDPDFPYSEIGLVYETVLGAMTEGYFREFPDLDAEHTQSMREFIRAEEPKEMFIESMIRNEAVEIFQKAKGDPLYLEGYIIVRYGKIHETMITLMN